MSSSQDSVIIECAFCGQKNKVSMEIAAKMVRRLVQVNCGKCHLPLVQAKGTK